MSSARWLYARVVGMEALVCGQEPEAQGPAEPGELASLPQATANGPPPVQELVGDDGGVVVAHPVRHDSGSQEACPWFAKAPCRLESRLTSIRAPTRRLRSARAARIPIVASLAVRTSTSATPTLVGLALGVAGDAHQAAEGLDDEVVPGQARPPPCRTRDRHVNQSRVLRCQFVIPQTQSGHATGFEVFHQDVGAAASSRASSRSSGSVKSRA